MDTKNTTPSEPEKVEPTKTVGTFKADGSNFDAAAADKLLAALKNGTKK